MIATREILVFVAFATLVQCSGTDEITKRGIDKATGVNTIPTGIQKPEYTYSAYSQNSNGQSSLPSQNYQTQIPNSFYPSHANQYYSSSSPTNDGTTINSHQNQVNVPSQLSSSQFNFVPSSGYQAKYQSVPSKSSNSNIHLAFLQPSSGLSTSHLSFPHAVYSQPTHITSYGNPLLNSVLPHGNFNFATNYQPLSFGSPYLGYPTVLFPQLSSPLYNNHLHSTPGQGIYYSTNTQPKYTYSQSIQSSTSNDYDKLQGSTLQSSPKDNDISAQSSELIHNDSVPGYKGGYTSRSSTYTK
ncbi:unnamed protein product [Parnassius apollo]|uniref:(apollo) hypothetical protein n=1 Tax=Parnassius apollo TaxID=110799 RepID=A0A8S3X4B2_PARAO|nr:unnamed protein product [Parnassius apollo]